MGSTVILDEQTIKNSWGRFWSRRKRERNPKKEQDAGKGCVFALSLDGPPLSVVSFHCMEA